MRACSIKARNKRHSSLFVTPHPICHGSKAAKTDHEEEKTREISDNDDKVSGCTELDVLMDFWQNFVKLQRQQQAPQYKKIK